MILIADSGSTKTDWRLIITENEIRSYSTSGLNPYFMNSEQISLELEKELVPFISNSKVRALYFYGAGCSILEKINIVEDGLKPVFPNADIYIFSDLLGAARALCIGGEGIACILGTGSNSCCFDGNQIVSNLPSLGYILGDEGSGAVLGKSLIKAILSEKAPTDIIQLFNTEFNQTRVEILNRVYQYPFPNRYFAAFSIFIHKYIYHPFLHQLVKDSFNNFIEQNIFLYPDFKLKQVHFTGSIAFYFQDILNESAVEKGINLGRIIQSPIDSLVPFHFPDLKKYNSLNFYER